MGGLLLYLAAINGRAFRAFAHDKRAARRDERRTPERTLILLALAGGAPAAGGPFAPARAKSRTGGVSTASLELWAARGWGRPRPFTKPVGGGRLVTPIGAAERPGGPPPATANDAGLAPSLCDGCEEYGGWPGGGDRLGVVHAKAPHLARRTK